MPNWPDRSSFPPDVVELQRQANALASQIQEHRERYPVPALVVKSSRWYRRWQFPLTLRKFERVFYAQGESFLARWTLAWGFAWTTLK